MRNALVNAFRAGLVMKDAGGARQISGGGFWGAVRESYAGAWQRGVSIDPIGGITAFGAVFACISRIATDIAKLEMLLTMPEGEIDVEVPSTSPYWAVLRKPNSFQNRIQFLTFWLVSKLLYGNAYAVKARDDARGIVTALYILDPRRVTPMVTPEGDVFYSLGGDDLARVPSGMVVPAREIIHDRGLTLWHPLIGVSPIYACGVSATQGRRIQANSAQFFENMSRPSGMLTAPGTIEDPTAVRLKKDWEENFSGVNIGRLAILGDGLKYEPMTIPANDAQLIQQLNWTVEDVARCFGVPLYKINAGAVPTAGNVEALETQYYSGCLQILIESLELCLTEGLMAQTGATAGYEVELDLEGLLRMDSGSQLDMLAKGVGGAIMKPDEARAKRNLPPVPGGNAVYLQQQNYSLEALAKRDALPDPFAGAKPAPPPAAPPAPDPAALALDLEQVVRKAVADAVADAKPPAQDPGAAAFLETVARAAQAMESAAQAMRPAPAVPDDDIDLIAIGKALGARLEALDV